MKQQKGTKSFPSLFLMNNESAIAAIETMLESILATDPTYFLVEARIKPTNNVKVFLDGDQGITIEKCVQFNRMLYKKIEESQLFPNGDFSLEVSSPGLDEPLKMLRQFRKNIGRQVELLLDDGRKKEGRLVEVTEDGIILEEPIGKPRGKGFGAKPTAFASQPFLFNHIKSTKIQVVF